MPKPTEKQIEAACAVYWGDHWNVFNATKVSIRETMSKALSAALAVEAGTDDEWEWPVGDAQVVLFDPRLDPFPKCEPHKIIDASLWFMDKAEIGERLYSRAQVDDILAHAALTTSPASSDTLPDRLYMLADNWKGRSDTPVGDEIRRRCATDLLKELSRGSSPASSAVEGEAVAEYRIVFDGFPSPEGPRFIEVEDEAGKSIKAGEWRKRADGLCELVIRPAPTPAGDAMLRLAVAAVLEADKEFRSNMGPSWEGDPLSDEIDGLRRIFEAIPASPAPHQEGRAGG